MESAARIRPVPALRLVEPEHGPRRLQRSVGAARVAFATRGDRTALADLYQSGCCKIRLPDQAVSGGAEAILVNTAGGLTDGDRIAVEARWSAGATAIVTTQACERIYRSRSDVAAVDNRLDVSHGAHAFWLPQETILFDGGRLRRTAIAELSGSAALTACEAVILGRPAMGETVRSGSYADSWEIRRDGRLVFADRLALRGDMAARLDKPGVGGGIRAFATLLHAGADSELMRDRLRAAFADEGIHAGISDPGGVMLARLAAADGYALRAMLRVALRTLRPAGLPRVWAG
ncbi:MAG: urease accessory protein UreD [Flavobacteriaceae bacterium]